MEIIVTDVTRFKDDSIRCVAGIEPGSGTCVRPRPYLSATECDTRKIVPGIRLKGDFVPDAGAISPHVEDYRYSRFTISGSAGVENFRSLLRSGLFSSIEQGFEIKLNAGEKHIPMSLQPVRSIITISVAPSQFQIAASQFQEGSLKASFSDGSAQFFSYLSITDLGLHNYTQNKDVMESASDLKNFFQRQREIYLRIGLSRPFRAPDGREGFWLQVNGIYSFPELFYDL